MTGARLRERGAAVVTAAALVLLVQTPSSAAEGDGALQVQDVDASELPELRFVVAVPIALASRALPPSAFSLRHDGEAVPADVRRVVDGGELVVVVDTAVGAEELGVSQGLAAELLRAVPESVATAVMTGSGRSTPLTYDVSRSLRAVGSLRPTRPEQAQDPLRSLADWELPSHRRTVQLLTTCAALRAPRPAPEALLAGQQRLNVLAAGDDCQDEADAATRPTSGLALLGEDLAQLTDAVDVVARDLLGQYEVQARVPDDVSDERAARLQVSLADRGSVLTGAVPLPVQPPEEPEPGLPVRLPLLACLAALIVVAGVSAVGGMRRR